MHAEPIWLPMTGKKTVVATDDRLCKGDFSKLFSKYSYVYKPQPISAIMNWKNNNKVVKRAPFTLVGCFRLCCSATFLA